MAEPPGGGDPARDYPGQPPNGKIYWGAAVGGNDDPSVRHEQPTGASLAIRRTYFSWAQRTTGLVNTARNDLSKNRLPWVSVYPNGCTDGNPCWTWNDIADGDYDNGIDQMLSALDALNGPVWLTVHHEPENEVLDNPGGPQGSSFVEMNRRVRQRIDALGVDNVALAPILMGWTFSPRAGDRDPNAYWAPGIFDFVGMDPYQSEQPGVGLVSPDWWGAGRHWAETKGVDVAVAEWGMKCTDEPNCAGNNGGARVEEWYLDAVGSHNDGGGARVVALSAFDSGENSPKGPWWLTGTELEMFHRYLVDSRTHRWKQGW